MAAAFVASPRAAPGGHPLPRSLDDRAGGDGATGGGDDGLAGRSLSLPRPQPPSQAALMPWMERANPTAILHILRSDEKEVGVFVFPNSDAPCLTVFGRDPAVCDIFVGHASVSRQHAWLSWQDGICYACPYETPTGTTVNGKALPYAYPTALQPGDTLVCGKSARRYVFLLDPGGRIAAAAAAARPGGPGGRRTGGRPIARQVRSRSKAPPGVKWYDAPGAGGPGGGHPGGGRGR
ncbi:hypothetical protein BU14_2596s0001, partial [Porphyra umbilicalis]